MRRVTYPLPVFLGLHITSTVDQYYLFAIVLALSLLVVAWYRRRVGAFYVGAGRMQPVLAAATGAKNRRWCTVGPSRLSARRCSGTP